MGGGSLKVPPDVDLTEEALPEHILQGAVDPLSISAHLSILYFFSLKGSVITLHCPFDSQ